MDNGIEALSDVFEIYRGQKFLTAIAGWQFGNAWESQLLFSFHSPGTLFG